MRPRLRLLLIAVLLSGGLIGGVLSTPRHATAASPSTASAVDPQGDVPYCQGDILSVNVDYQDSSGISMGLTTACASNPTSDPSWTAAGSGTVLAFFMDTNGDGDDEFAAIVTPPLAGGPPSAHIVHIANGDFTPVCAGPMIWNGSTGFSLNVPATCVGSPSQVQLWAGIMWDENPTGTTCTCPEDDAPDAVWIGPVVPGGTTTTTTSPSSTTTTTAPPPPPVTPSQGYWLVASDGGIFSFGGARFHGSTGAIHLNRPIVGMASTPDGLGYWLVASDGGVFAFGNARFYGSTGAIHLNQPIVGMAATPDGTGYWLVASDGGIFSFGTARFFGSTGAIHLNRPIVGMATAPDGTGYWLVASDGGIFSFGGAVFYGSAGSLTLSRPIVGMATAGSGRGYWLAAADGGIFGFGPDGVFHGSGTGKSATAVVGIASTGDRLGYRLVTSDGQVESFGDAQPFGDLVGVHLTQPVVGVASSG